MRPGISEFLIASALILEGCSNGTTTPSSFAPAGLQVTDVGDARKPSEILKSARVVVKVVSCSPSGLDGEATFTVKGKAKGRVRGKFSAKGAFNFDIISGKTLWEFSETFEIKGKHPTDGTVTGYGTDSIVTCKTFGPTSELGYHLGTKSGKASTDRLKNGGPFVQQLH